MIDYLASKFGERVRDIMKVSEDDPDKIRVKGQLRPLIISPSAEYSLKNFFGYLLDGMHLEKMIQDNHEIMNIFFDMKFYYKGVGSIHYIRAELYPKDGSDMHVLEYKSRNAPGWVRAKGEVTFSDSDKELGPNREIRVPIRMQALFCHNNVVVMPINKGLKNNSLTWADVDWEKQIIRSVVFDSKDVLYMEYVEDSDEKQFGHEPSWLYYLEKYASTIITPLTPPELRVILEETESLRPLYEGKDIFITSDDREYLFVGSGWIRLDKGTELDCIELLRPDALEEYKMATSLLEL